MKKSFLLLLTLVVLSIYHVGGNNTDSRVHTGWWIYNHNDYAKTGGKHDPRVKWAFDVFQRVKTAADKTGDRFPRLVIIDTRGEPYALAVPDGGIIINPITLDTCYGSGRTEGDRRLAFILGHELAHLVNKDFMHREAFLALKKHGNEKANQEISKHFHLSKPGKARERRLKELMADRYGMLYASMAGYDIAGLFEKGNDFFIYLANKLGTGNVYGENDKYPSLKDRANFIEGYLSFSP